MLSPTERPKWQNYLEAQQYNKGFAILAQVEDKSNLLDLQILVMGYFLVPIFDDNYVDK